MIESNYCQNLLSKAEFAEEGTFFREQISFPVNKKVGNRKNFYFISFKSCILGGLSFIEFQLFYYQKFPGKEICSWKKYLLPQIRL